MSTVDPLCVIDVSYFDWTICVSKTCARALLTLAAQHSAQQWKRNKPLGVNPGDIFPSLPAGAGANKYQTTVRSFDPERKADCTVFH